MPDKNGILQVKFTTDIDDIIGVTSKRGVFRFAVGLKVGAACTDVIEQDSSEIMDEGGFYITPHVLVAAKTVSEDHRFLTRTPNTDIVSRDRVQVCTV